jgi:hypothetical protein
MTTKMFIDLLILVIVASPFVQFIWDKIDKRLHRPERPDQLEKAAKELSTWLLEGKGQELVGDDFTVKYEFDPKHDERRRDLDRWLRRSPFLTLKQGETLDPDERTKLEHWFRRVLAFLTIVGIAAALGIVFVWNHDPDKHKLAICVFSAFFGGCIAAFRSCLDRRANGFEDKYGNRSPDPADKKQRFGGGMARWFIGRPLLSASVGLLLFFGLEGKVFPEALIKEISGEESKTVAPLVFYACLAGLLAKTLLDLFLEAGKKLFRVEKD